MKAYFIIIYTLASFIPRLLFSQTEPTDKLINQKAKDVRGNEMLIGKCTRSALLEAPYSEWFPKNYDDYKVDSFTAALVKPLLKNRSIIIFMGTWCGDSRREVPRMLKILDCCGFPEQQLQLVMVSNHEADFKQSPQHEEQGRNIVRVPTMIIEEQQQEAGRIVEFPVVSLEKDLLSILQKGKYIPNYSASSMLLQKVFSVPLDAMEKQKDELAALVKPMLTYPFELAGLGYFLLCRKKNGEALLIYRLNTAVNPTDPKAYNSLADAYWKTGDAVNAKQTLHKSLELDANNAATKELIDKIGL